MRARFWWVVGQLWLVRARRHELAARRLKVRAEEFFQRIGGDDGR